VAKGMVFFSSAMARESTMEMWAPKKKLQGFPMFFTSEKFKNSLNGRYKAVFEPSA
jgi:hypothetical protein